MKKMTLAEFKEYVKTHDKNTFKTNGLGNLFHDAKDHFVIVCKKCGSLNVEFEGEEGCDYGGMTGYSPGEQVIKCKDCGNAITWYQ